MASAVEAVCLAGATTIVTNMANDTWNSIREFIVRILNRGDTEVARQQQAAIEEAYISIREASSETRAIVIDRQRDLITALLLEVLMKEPQALNELSSLLAELEERQSALIRGGSQQARAEGDAQQAVQYLGTQTNTFGRDGKQQK